MAWSPQLGEPRTVKGFAHRGQGANDGYRDQGCNEAILDGRRAVLILDKPDHRSKHAGCSVNALIAGAEMAVLLAKSETYFRIIG